MKLKVTRFCIELICSHFSLQLLVVLATILERNPEVELSQCINLDEVTCLS